jgi:hypothetical protein
MTALVRYLPSMQPIKSTAVCPQRPLLQILREAIFGHFQTLDFMKVHQIVSQEI